MILSNGGVKEATARIVRETISSILPNVAAEVISGNKSLADLGADSVDRVEIILSIMGRLGMDEPMVTFSSIADIDQLVDYLCTAQQR